MIRVALVGPDAEGRGGMAAVLAAMLRSPLAERYELEPITTYRGTRPVDRLVLFARSLLRLVVWCRGPGRRVVHVHMAARGSMYRKAVVVLVCKTAGRRVLLQVHAGPGDLDDFLARLGRFRAWGLRVALTRADRVVSVSESGAATLARLLPKTTIGVVANAPPSPVAARPVRTGRTVTVLYLGGFEDPAKGGEVIFAALPTLLADPAVELRLAGPGAPPALPDSERLRWLGYLDPDGLAKAFAATDVFVLPSISEGLPVALLEAMAQRLAIVASRVGGVPEVLVDGESAVLIEPRDAAALVAAVLALAADPEERRRLGDAAAARLGWIGAADVYDRLGRIYDELAS
jgi:glycosyltransferase involved in cell wall biosynthesis